MPGIFITFEGPEGCGKTTQSAKLVEYLKQKKLDVVYTREPGGTLIGDKIRKILLDVSNKGMAAECEFFLYMANRAQNVFENIKSNKKAGKIIICDRFMDATLAYQGFARGLDLNTLIEINKFAIMDEQPDLTFVLDVPADEGLKKAVNQEGKECTVLGKGDRIEQEGIEFHTKVREGYLTLKKMFPERIEIIDKGTIEETFDAIKKIIIKRFKI